MSQAKHDFEWHVDQSSPASGTRECLNAGGVIAATVSWRLLSIESGRPRVILGPRPTSKALGEARRKSPQVARRVAVARRLPPSKLTFLRTLVFDALPTLARLRQSG